MSKKFLTIKEAAEILGVTPLTLRNWDKSGKFSALRHPINNYRVYRLEDIQNLITDMKPASYSKTGKKIRKLEIKHTEEN